MLSASPSLPGLLKLLSEPTRLRALALLEVQELSVGELSRSLGMAQSRVSNHLRLLREHDLLAERHVGTSTFLRLALPTGEREGTFLGRLWETLRAELPTMGEHAADLERLRQVLAERRAESRDFFDRVAGDWDKIGASFATGQARQRAAANLLPAGMVLADFGCGTGYMGRSLLTLCSRLICVDSSAGMLEEARARLSPPPPGTELELRRGELDELPLETDEVDGAVAGMVLHHLPDAAPALAEMFRVIRPGGTLVVLELAPHREVWMQEALRDRHLGLDARDVSRALERAGFVDVRNEPVQDRYQPTPPEGTDPVELALYVVRGRVPASR